MSDRKERALVPAVAPGGGPPPGGAPRSYAPLLAQLIAGRLSLPQTRARRRADPRDADAAYGTALRTVAWPRPGIPRNRVAATA